MKRPAFIKGAALLLFLYFFQFVGLGLWMEAKPRFRRWAEPRQRALKLLRTASSIGITLLFLYQSSRKTAEEKRIEGWSFPGRMRGLDKLMRQALAEGKFKYWTFIGVANGRRPVLLSVEERGSHMQIVGPTRSGKSQLLMAISAQDMRWGMPIFYMEAKGDRGDFNQFLKEAAATDRLPAVRYFNPQDPQSMNFNPIRPVPGQDATAIANQIARAIGREPSFSGEGQDYYNSVDFAKIQNMAEVFSATGKQFSLRDCFYYFSFKAAREKAFDLCPDRKLVGLAYRGFDQNQETTALTSALRPWTTGRLGELLNSYSPQIKLEEVFAGQQLAYFAIPTGYLQVMANSLGRMVISGLLSIASSRQIAAEKPIPASIILDEFSEFATPVFASFIATVGSARMWTILSHQDLGQLKRIQGMNHEAFSSAIFNNTSGCKISFRTPNPDDAEFWAATLGTYETFADTERLEEDFAGLRGTGQKSRRTVEAFKVHPNKLKNLFPGMALVYSPGKEDCLALTASAYRVFPGPTPPMPQVEPSKEEGLELESSVRGFGGERVDQTGFVKA